MTKYQKNISPLRIRIEIFEKEHPLSGNQYYVAEIYLNDKWFKEIAGLSSKKEVLKAILTNEDFLETIKSNSHEKDVTRID